VNSPGVESPSAAFRVASGGLEDGNSLRVGGVTPFTTIDFPGRLAAVVWVQGCPWRCLYCHNPHLQPREATGAHATRPWASVATWLEKRVGLIDGVVFSGGEPTIDPGLRSAMEDVRRLGLAVGLHTGGIYPRRLAEVLPLVDWVGFDVKAPLAQPTRLDDIVGVPGMSSVVARSLAELFRAGVEFECRTTAHPAYLSEPDLLLLAQELSTLGAKSYAVQVARPVEGSALALEPCSASYPSSSTLHKLKEMFTTFELRRE
jgi:pyruvate formate lyase activating enzyme